MEISNDHPAFACLLIDAADLAHVQGGANQFGPGEGPTRSQPTPLGLGAILGAEVGIALARRSGRAHEF